MSTQEKLLNFLQANEVRPILGVHNATTGMSHIVVSCSRRAAGQSRVGGRPGGRGERHMQLACIIRQWMTLGLPASVCVRYPTFHQSIVTTSALDNLHSINNLCVPPYTTTYGNPASTLAGASSYQLRYPKLAVNSILCPSTYMTREAGLNARAMTSGVTRDLNLEGRGHSIGPVWWRGWGGGGVQQPRGL